jgi:hypothetical protein
VVVVVEEEEEEIHLYRWNTISIRSIQERVQKELMRVPSQTSTHTHTHRGRNFPKPFSGPVLRSSYRPPLIFTCGGLFPAIPSALPLRCVYALATSPFPYLHSHQLTVGPLPPVRWRGGVGRRWMTMPPLILCKKPPPLPAFCIYIAINFSNSSTTCQSYIAIYILFTHNRVYRRAVYKFIRVQ